MSYLLLIFLISCLQFCLTGAIYFEDKVKLRLYREGYTLYEEAHISRGETLFHESKGFNQTLPLVLIIHGMDTGADCYFVNGLIRAFAKRKLTEEYNILAVDMPELFEDSLRNQFYLGILANVQPIGQAIGEMFSRVIKLQLTTPEHINIISYSMGAQVAGYAAREVQRSSGKINFIAGLDPAGPGFHTKWKGHPALLHVSGADSRVTHFYHTNSVSCGTRDRVGTADFVFNSGMVQPGCTSDKGLDCSHTRVPHLYIEAVYRPHNFVARKCSSWQKFRSCVCNKQETVSISFPPDFSANGLYYLRTKDQTPFALRKKGSRCGKIVHKPKKKTIKTPRSLVESQIKPLTDYILPKYNEKKSFMINLLEGIQKMADTEKPYLYEEKTSNEKKENESKGAINNLNEVKVENSKPTDKSREAKSLMEKNK